MAIQIPAPLPSDSDKVVNLLQNAAFFRRVGDTEEALHFLRQAAECAGDNGDDARTLALARSAAELSGALGSAGDSSAEGTAKEGRSGVHERRLPQPPPRSRPAEAEATSEDEPVLLLRRTAPYSKPPSAAEGDETRKPPSDRPPESKSALAPPPLPSVRANGSRPPKPSVRPLPSRPAAPQAAPSRPGPASRPGFTPRAASASRPAPPSMRPLTALPGASRASSAPAPEVAHPSVRQAVRVSVERSAAEPGLLLVRVLDEGKPAEPGCTEALLVSLDSSAQPFTG